MNQGVFSYSEPANNPLEVEVGMELVMLMDLMVHHKNYFQQKDPFDLERVSRVEASKNIPISLNYRGFQLDQQVVSFC